MGEHSAPSEFLLSIWVIARLCGILQKIMTRILKHGHFSNALDYAVLLHLIMAEISYLLKVVADFCTVVQILSIISQINNITYFLISKIVSKNLIIRKPQRLKKSS